jgi:hypothetical protein
VGIHAEYLEAAAKFPFDLPSGRAFPPKSSLQYSVTSRTMPETKVMWERGNGIAEVYMFWPCAVATAAYEAHVRGDRVGVESLLDTLEAGYSSDVRRSVLEDPADGFLKVDAAEARTGDFSSLKYVAQPETVDWSRRTGPCSRTTVLSCCESARPHLRRRRLDRVPQSFDVGFRRWAASARRTRPTV